MMPHGDQRPPRTPLSRQQRSSWFFFFHEAVVLVQHVTYGTDFSRVGRVVNPSWGTAFRNFDSSGTVVVAAAALQPVR